MGIWKWGFRSVPGGGEGGYFSHQELDQLSLPRSLLVLPPTVCVWAHCCSPLVCFAPVPYFLRVRISVLAFSTPFAPFLFGGAPRSAKFGDSTHSTHCQSDSIFSYFLATLVWLLTNHATKGRRSSPSPYFSCRRRCPESNRAYHP